MAALLKRPLRGRIIGASTAQADVIPTLAPWTMALFRRRRAIADYVASVGGVILTRDVYAMVEQFVSAGVLTEDDVENLDYELAPFELAVWFELFLGHLGSRDENTMGALSGAVGSGLHAAHLKQGLADGEAMAQTLSLVERMSEVLIAATLRQAREKREYDRFFLLAFGLVERVVGEEPRREDAQRVVQVQQIARSVIDAASHTFADSNKEYRLVL
jgi:hypothetical protein